ncbi:hypothetical protein PVAND_015721 [Polypedilum vanderplanki]|uniref:Glycoprotein hormone subunit beta domain-containing protein n=1 Tax=Polypedilum vanderplanki TaxID=319348 RepID=A0A9J6BDP6_POLVA|nr:hypothetical protein PVAND_015721 [Polypedilum vanderplanki]
MGNYFVPILVLFSLYFASCISTEFPAIIEQEKIIAPIGCHRRLYTFQVTQTDSKGYVCSEKVTVNACYGRCDSKEISDWKFPFKRSYHPVCVPKGITKVVIMLENCDPEAGLEARRYEYLEPLSCNCQICSSINTSCESPQLLHKNHQQVAGGKSSASVPIFDGTFIDDNENFIANNK